MDENLGLPPLPEDLDSTEPEIPTANDEIATAEYDQFWNDIVRFGPTNENLHHESYMNRLLHFGSTHKYRRIDPRILPILIRSENDVTTYEINRLLIEISEHIAPSVEDSMARIRQPEANSDLHERMLAILPESNDSLNQGESILARLSQYHAAINSGRLNSIDLDRDTQDATEDLNQHEEMATDNYTLRSNHHGRLGFGLDDDNENNISDLYNYNREIIVERETPHIDRTISHHSSSDSSPETIFQQIMDDILESYRNWIEVADQEIAQLQFQNTEGEPSLENANNIVNPIHQNRNSAFTEIYESCNFVEAIDLNNFWRYAENISNSAIDAELDIKSESEHQTSPEIATTVFNEIRRWFAAFIKCISCKKTNRSE